ncbi:MAG TPA: collagenase-like protease [Erysipelotrichaceae bacterium]|nr:collagenase-like protease [Erysipelotrichaceae bacterium]
MKKIELLAPAGDLEKCKTAILYGADAVYLGGKKFSLRSRASNFDIEDIKEACDFARSHNANIHVTVNIIPHESDFEGIKEYLKTLEEIGVTAIIVASPAIGQIARKVASKLEIHLSTQLSITNYKSVEYFDDIKPDRVVLARECTMDEIRYITKNIKTNTETFIHGGMCVNYSGRCTISNALTLRDANRGGCAQSCRWKYHLYDGDNKISDDEILFSMSSKDLMAIDKVYDMIEANVSSLKIEGRMKSNYYIATVVKTYRKLIDEIYETKKRPDKDRIEYYEREIAKAENRLTSSGFYDGLPDESGHLYGVNGAGVTHDFIGVILDQDDDYAYVQTRNLYRLNDELEVFGPDIDNETFVVTTIIDENDENVELVNRPMSVMKINIPFKVSKGDMIRRFHNDN